jgi:hypothetical protein
VMALRMGAAAEGKDDGDGGGDRSHQNRRLSAAAG